jgi:hypothetical protein
MPDPDTSAELNRLYWESDESVGDIADRLDLSRRSLYDGIEPRPADATCSECGEGLVFRNRTARENLEAECPGCGRVVELEEPGPTESEPAAEQERRAAELSPVDTPGSGPLLAIALLGGLVLGAVLAYLYRSG